MRHDRGQVRLHLYSAAIAIGLLAFLTACAPPEELHWDNRTGSAMAKFADRTYVAEQSGIAPDFTPLLVDQDSNARFHAVVVRVKIQGVGLVDPGSTGGQIRQDQAHLRFTVDHQPAQETAQETFEITGLSRGEHTISVELVNNIGEPVVGGKRIKVNIP